MLQTNQNPKVRNAILLGTLCTLAYLAVYIARNILGTVQPQIEAAGVFNKEVLGVLSSIYFTCYACGQLVNGLIGNRVKAKYMMSFGLAFAGVCTLLFPLLSESVLTTYIVYGATGFFLSMIYAPMTKVVAENTEPLHAIRCSLGYTFSSFLGSPIAGVLAAMLTWQGVFYASSGALLFMAAACFISFLIFEKTGIVQYGKFQAPQTASGGSIRVLIQHKIVKFTLIAVLTGIIRTTVVHWLTTYIVEYLGFDTDTAALIYTAATVAISASAFCAVFLYERLGHNIHKTVLISFCAAAASFLLVYLCKQSMLNISFMVLAILFANCASSMLWSIYCPSLRDTGMVSSATGFLDFMSYMAAAASSTIFAKAAGTIGWSGLILVWFGLMVVGVIVTLPYDKFKRKAP